MKHKSQFRLVGFYLSIAFSAVSFAEPLIAPPGIEEDDTRVRVAGRDPSLCEADTKNANPAGDFFRGGDCRLLSQENAPSVRKNEVFLYSEGKIYVWGGEIYNDKNQWVPTETGAIYNIATEKWMVIQSIEAPLFDSSVSAQIFNKKMWIYFPSQKRVHIYDPDLQKWSQFDEKSLPDLHPKDWSSQSRYDWLPSENGKPQMHSPPSHLIQSNFSFPRADSYTAIPLRVLGKFGSNELLGVGTSLEIILGFHADKIWMKMNPPIGNLDITESHPIEIGRNLRLVWTGRELIAWGGVRAKTHRYDCSRASDCPPGAPCMPRSCTFREETYFNDGLTFTPDENRWSCLYRIKEKMNPLLGLMIKETPSGLVVNQLVKGFPAEKSGILIDDVILKINKLKVKTFTEFKKTIGDLHSGQKVDLELSSAGQNKMVSMQLKYVPEIIPGSCASPGNEK